MDVGLPKQTALFHYRFYGTGRAIGGDSFRLNVGASGAMHVKWVYCSHSSSPNLCKNAPEILKNGRMDRIEGMGKGANKLLHLVGWLFFHQMQNAIYL